MLTWIAAHTTTIDVGSAIFQIPGRSPAMTAMTAATIDTLSGGRFRLGLGVSGPQVSEGWHGVRFDKPLGRTREYIDIVRLALSRERVAYQGEHFTLPLPDGPGKALKMIIHPIREYMPIYLAAIGPKNLELAGEKCDGWLAIFYDPEFAPELLASVNAGKAKAGRADAPFDVVPTMPVLLGDDLAARRRPGPRATPRSTSAGWARASRTSTTGSPSGWASRPRPRRSRTSTSTASTPRPAPPCRWTSSTAPRCSARSTGWPTGCRRSPRSGVTTVNVSCFGATQDERIAGVRAAAEALDKSGTGRLERRTGRMES